MGTTKNATVSRLLAFLAISCSIAAVARVSGDVLLLPVGVAGLAAGNVYMWRTRYAASRLRTGVLLLLLIILLFYLGRQMLFSWTTDPILLARYLVYGLIVSSFDLRTRRNVVGTLVLAGMLFVLLSQMAFDVWFPVLMVGFVLLAVASASVGRLEEEAGHAIVVGGGSWRATGKIWVGFVLVFLPLAGAIFLLMPRFGSAGLATANWLPSRIDLTAGGPAALPSQPSAAVSPEILVGQAAGGTYATLGYAGSAADTPVMYVRSRVASYWRGSTLDLYDGIGWLPSVTRVALLNEGRGEYVFPESPRNLADRTWYSQTYYVMVDQPSAMFTGYNPGRLYLPQSSQVSLSRGTVYRAVSPLPQLSPRLLRQDSVDTTDQANLALPPISERTAALAESIVQGALTDYAKAARLEQFLLRRYRYDLGVKPLTPGRDAVDVFLFEEQAGYCAQFATAMAVMARHVGLPARVAIGYVPGLYDPMTGAYTVRAGDAHAWVEVLFRNSGWVAFDPTPRPDVSLGAGGGQGLVSFALADIVGGNFTGAISSLTGGWFVRRLPVPGWTWPALLGAAVAAGIMVALLASRRKARARHGVNGYTPLPGETRRTVLEAYRKMVSMLSRKGLPPRHPAQTPREYARLVGPQISGGREVVEWLTEAATVAAYDPRPFGPSTAGEVRGMLAALKRTLARRPRRLARGSGAER